MKIRIALLLILFSSAVLAQNGLNFDGVDDHVATGNPGPMGTADRTVELWVRTSNSINSQQVLVDWGDMTVGQRFTLNILNFGRLRIEVGGNGFNSTTTIADGNWHHVAVTYDNSASVKARLYIDGLLDASGNFTVSVNTSNINGVILGKRNDNVNFYEGDMDDVRIWDYARTANEINSDKDREICTAETGLMYLYNLNQHFAFANNSGRIFAFDQINNNTGQLLNFGLNGTSSNWVIGKTLNKGIIPGVTRNASALIAVDSTVSYNWFDCTTLSSISGDTNRVFVAPANGSYGVALSNGFCVDSSSCYPVINVGIQEQQANFDLSFNNPVQNLLKIRYSPENQLDQFSLYNFKGQELGHQKAGGNGYVEFDLSEQAAGVFLLRAFDQEGRSQTYRVVKN